MEFDDANERKDGESNFHKDKRALKFFLLGLAAGVAALAAAWSLFQLVGPIFMRMRPGLGDYDSPAFVQAKIKNIYQILDENYVNGYDKKETLENLYYGIVSGVGDPYTVYFSPDVFDKFKEETQGTYAGIGVGINIDKASNSIVVISPFDGGPGARAGILPGDWIVRVNGEDVRGDMLNEAVSMMKGEPGTRVSVTIFRPGEDRSIDLEIVRERIDVPTVSHRMLENDIAYIRISQFDGVTYDQFLAAYTSLKPDMRGLIIDLRNNPGGLLHIVTKIADLLVPKGVIVYQEDKKGQRRYSFSDETHVETPLLILVNGNSASASEVLSGAVQDVGVGELVGTQTFGKGVVQNIFPMTDGSAVKVTVAKYYTPNGTCIQDVGLTPDYKVDMDDDLTVRISSITETEDVQLDKAIEIMCGKLGAARWEPPVAEPEETERTTER
jgi:carboxyl-terminal processing protease